MCWHLAIQQQFSYLLSFNFQNIEHAVFNLNIFTWFLYHRYIDELSNQLKKEFPLASPTEKDEGINKDSVVHIYYKVYMLEKFFIFPW